MKFPVFLLQKNRKKKVSKKIKNWNFLYTRHKPSTDWNEEEGLPDFTKIKIDQSFNWCNFSIPIWTRFTDKKEYLSEYAVAGFKVKTIRNEHLTKGIFDTRVIDIEHKPVAANYSHCELIKIRDLNKAEKREIRATLRHKCIIPLRPNEKRNFFLRTIDIFIMYIRRFFSGNI